MICTYIKYKCVTDSITTLYNKTFLIFYMTSTLNPASSCRHNWTSNPWSLPRRKSHGTDQQVFSNFLNWRQLTLMPGWLEETTSNVRRDCGWETLLHCPLRVSLGYIFNMIIVYNTFHWVSVLVISSTWLLCITLSTACQSWLCLQHDYCV